MTTATMNMRTNEIEKRPIPQGLRDSRILFLVGLLIAASGIVSPPVALIGGVAFGFAVEHPYRAEAGALAKLLLQACVIALGFGTNLKQVFHAGRSGFLYSAISIAVAMALGMLLGKLLQVGGKASYLITVGTAICGGSAIAAISPITKADDEEIGVAMGTVFLLNSIALLLFPFVGHLLRFNQNQFGLWAALAIHDTSSVVGASAAYGSQALVIGTTVKLTRALWIVPVSLLTAAFVARSENKNHGEQSQPHGKIKMPWFIGLFVVAAAMSTWLPEFHPAFVRLNYLGRTGLTATLFLIGTSLSKKALQKVGVRPLVQGISLWIVVASVSATAIYLHWISI